MDSTLWCWTQNYTVYSILYSLYRLLVTIHLQASIAVVQHVKTAFGEKKISN